MEFSDHYTDKPHNRPGDVPLNHTPNGEEATTDVPPYERPDRGPDTTPFTPGEGYGEGDEDIEPLPDDEWEDDFFDPPLRDYRPFMDEERITELKADFEPYRAQRDDILDKIEEGEDPETIEGYRATGSLCYVFDTPDGKILKIPAAPQDYLDDEEDPEPSAAPNPNRIFKYVYPLEETRDHPGVEKMAAMDDGQGGAVVCEPAPGKNLDKMTPEEKNSITSEDFVTMLENAKALPPTVALDFSAENIFRDEEAGITIIDLEPADDASPTNAEIAAKHFAQPGVLLKGFGYTNDLPPVAEHYMEAYQEIFGDEAADALSEMWHEYGVGVNPAPEFTAPPDIGEALEEQNTLLRPVLGRDANVLREVHPPSGGIFDAYRCPDGATPEQLEAGRQASEALRDYDICVLPTQVVAAGDSLYRVTQRPQGDTLYHTPRAQFNADLERAIDKTWAGLCDNLVDGLLQDHPTPADPGNPERWKAGSFGLGMQKLWLADVPTATVRPRDPDAFEHSLLELANNVRELELELIGLPLTAAREAIRGALAHARHSEQYGDGLVQSIRRVIDSAWPIQIRGEEAIQQHRTQ